MGDFVEATDKNYIVLKLIEKLRHVLQQRIFNLAKYITTDERILQTKLEDDRFINVDEINDPNLFKRILGKRWRVCNDTLSFNTDKLHNFALKKKPIQRNLLRATSSIADPIAIASPITMRLQIIDLEKSNEMGRPNHT